MPAQDAKVPIPSGIPGSKRFRSITTLLIIVFLGIGGIIFFITNGLNLFFNLNREQQLIGSAQTRIARDAANQVREFVNEKFRILDQAAYVNDLIAAPDRRELVLNKLIGRVPSFRQLLLIDREGNHLQKASRLSSSLLINLTPADTSLLLSAIRENKNYIGITHIDPSTQEPIIIIAVPAKNVFGDIGGSLIAEINLKFMWDLVGNLKIGEGGLAFVVDRQGNLLAFKDISRVLKRENLSQNPEVAEYMARESEEQEKSIDILNGIQGNYVVSTYVVLDKPDWAVVVELPVFEAYKSLIQEVALFLIILVASAVLGIIATIFISKNITKPIIKLTAAVKNIKEENLGTQIDVDSEDEIGELASVFNQMSLELKQSYGNLEQKVKERTVTLDHKIAELEKFNKLTIGRELKMIEMKKELADLKGGGK